MEDQAQAVGSRVRYWRMRRNIDRQRFADMVGRSISWVDKIEKGERSLARLPMLERVAEALSVDPKVLTDGPSARRAADCVDANEVRAIRAALSSYPSLAVGSGARESTSSLKAINGQLAYIGEAWLSSHFTVVARHLPDLIRNVQSVALTADAENYVSSQRALVTTYRLASSMLLKFDAVEIAWLAADRAMQAALQSDDTWALARATRSVARAMTSTGQEGQALAVISGMLDRMRPEVGGDQDLLPMYGMLFLAGSIAAAKQGDPHVALQMHKDADRLAIDNKLRLSGDPGTFGSANVAVHRVSALARLNEGNEALRYVSLVDPKIISTLPTERRANYLLDLSTANIQTGRYDSAARALGEAERLAPEEVRCRPLAHGLLRSLVRNTGGELGRTVQRIATRAGVEA
ncbi:helix-turn-helix domain-containing protein [Kribbella deserti]|uniref:Helix-turn-helix domain-containing protein n=1 Tax=Kribbella deserti TaxID=1926257 RepID=A0ABV6QX88_9ACTN